MSLPGQSGGSVSQELAGQVACLIGSANVLAGEALENRHPGYCSSSYDCGVLVTPRNSAEISAICGWAAKRGVSVVAHGGLTGLVDATSTTTGQIAMSFEKMADVIRIDRDQQTAVVQAGVTLQQLQEAALEHGLMPGIDLPSRGSCTLGGMAATNAGGIQVLRYGMMRDSILGLEAVLGDGRIVDLRNTLLKSNKGYDLKNLLIGSEGTLGLVTEITLRLHRRPEALSTALLAGSSVEQLIALHRLARDRLGSSLLAFEVMWPQYIQATAHVAGVAPIDLAKPSALYYLIELGQWGYTDAAQSLERFFAEAFEAGLVEDGVIAQSQAQRQQLWLLREDSDAIDRVHGNTRSYDIGLKLADMPDYVGRLKTIFERECPETSLYVFGHVGDGNLHVMAGPVAQDGPGGPAHLDRLIYDLLTEYGSSSISAEHGIGVTKLAEMGRTVDISALETMRRIKTALDPHNVLNPGKTLPLPAYEG